MLCTCSKLPDTLPRTTWPAMRSSLGSRHVLPVSSNANVIPEKGFVNAVYSHRLDELLGLAGIKKRLQDDMKNDALLSAAWDVASKWNETSRYQMYDQFAAASMIHAVGDQNHGVLQWLKKHW